ncbi:unnamed protein product [Mycetohabitans rhizoxinica HKI 454]|uniref:Uncharacterized protein n=1 Tax=Mycetohabitans rhizoxinica (strain DSM 19002 / CIP 109453 / HKI 454) TaxID=882378 RepID=E5AN63_MYCRK|nr:unnamed protein product [Mycetohabitans rhizoxinica HKI 454]
MAYEELAFIMHSVDAMGRPSRDGSGPYSCKKSISCTAS